MPVGVWFCKLGGGAAIEFTKGTHATVKAACFKSTGELDESGAGASVYIADDADGATAQFGKTITVERTTGRTKID